MSGYKPKRPSNVKPMKTIEEHVWDGGGRVSVEPQVTPTRPQLQKQLQKKKEAKWDYTKFADDSKPKLRDFHRDTSLGKWMKDNIEVDSPQRQKERHRIYQEIEATVQLWVQEACAAKGLPHDFAGMSFYVAGSHRLELHEPESDIDMVAVCCTHVSPEDFFEDMPAIFEEREEVTDMVSVPDAMVPIMEFMYDGVRINLMFAQLPRVEVPPSLDINDDLILQGVEEDSVLMSLNGPRTTELIIQLVPEYDTFVKVLRCVRMWAKRRGLYSNKIGFLGGVNWAILVAFVCKLHPNATAASVFHKFFWWMKQWSWPKPIHICNVVDVGLGHKMWDPQSYPGDARDLMPIITPAYPTFNSSFNVNYSTLETMKREFARAFDKVNQVMKDEAKGWDAVFEHSDFFTRYNYYIQVWVSAADAQGWVSWSG